MWIIFLLKYIREEMRKESTFGVLLHSKHFKMFSKSRMQLYLYTPISMVDGFLLSSADVHTVFASPYLP